MSLIFSRKKSTCACRMHYASFQLLKQTKHPRVCGGRGKNSSERHQIYKSKSSSCCCEAENKWKANKNNGKFSTRRAQEEWSRTRLLVLHVIIVQLFLLCSRKKASYTLMQLLCVSSTCFNKVHRMKCSALWRDARSTAECNSDCSRNETFQVQLFVGNIYL
jgi:hypothetical protein